jgi:hypothetical protein
MGGCPIWRFPLFTLTYAGFISSGIRASVGQGMYL